MLRGRGGWVSLVSAGLVFAAAIALLSAGSSATSAQRLADAGIVRLGAPVPAMTWDDGALWVIAGKRVVRIGPATMAVRRGPRIASLCNDAQIAAGEGSVWVTSGGCSISGTLTEIDQQSLRVVGSGIIPGGATGVAVWQRRVWVTAPAGPASIWEFGSDAFPRRLTPAVLDVGGVPQDDSRAARFSSLLATPDRLWAVAGTRGRGMVGLSLSDGGLHGVRGSTRQPRIDAPLTGGPAVMWAAFGSSITPLDAYTGQVVGHAVTVPDDFQAVAGEDGEVWIASPRGLARSALRARTVADSRPLGNRFEVSALTLGGGFVWAASQTGELRRVPEGPSA